jgi:hypothetical protein
LLSISARANNTRKPTGQSIPAEAFPETPLLGATPKDKGLVVMWERFAELEGFAAVMEGVRNKTERLKGRAIAGPHGYEQIPGLVDKTLEQQ